MHQTAIILSAAVDAATRRRNPPIRYRSPWAPALNRALWSCGSDVYADPKGAAFTVYVPRAA